MKGYYLKAGRAAVLLLLLAVALGGAVSSGDAASAGAAMTPFSGGPFEASGVAHVPGTDGVLFVDDGRPEEVFWMRVGPNGSQASAVKSVRLGASVIDLEGMTFDGTHFYVVGSQSKSKGGDLSGLVRFRFDAAGQRVEGTEAVNGLKPFLAANVAELRGMEKRKYSDGGINIEGIAWDPRGGRLLLGLRSPVVDGQALVVPLRLRDPRGAFTAANLEVEGGRAIRLPFGGAGIRSIEHDARTNSFRVITGAGPNAERLDFKLWEWDGSAERPSLRELSTFDRSLKPEGVTRVSTDAREFGFIVFDTSGYAAAE
ncbi:MAG TPA: DUF3616 domain-containing protein [Pyrinomonadaceae bacterium]|nr:DUF3616 domain-containing protein [Pyrinomonadaceae bacterium]